MSKQFDGTKLTKQASDFDIELRNLIMNSGLDCKTTLSLLNCAIADVAKSIIKQQGRKAEVLSMLDDMFQRMKILVNKGN